MIAARDKCVKFSLVSDVFVDGYVGGQIFIFA